LALSGTLPNDVICSFYFGLSSLSPDLTWSSLYSEMKFLGFELVMNQYLGRWAQHIRFGSEL
jgi:hypothetical protein